MKAKWILLAMPLLVLALGCIAPSDEPVAVPHRYEYRVTFDCVYIFENITTPEYHTEDFATQDHAELYVSTKLAEMQKLVNNATRYRVEYHGNYTIAEIDQEYVTERVVRHESFSFSP